MKRCHKCGTVNLKAPTVGEEWLCESCGTKITTPHRLIHSIDQEGMSSGCRMTPKKIVPYEGYED